MLIWMGEKKEMKLHLMHRKLPIPLDVNILCVLHGRARENSDIDGPLSNSGQEIDPTRDKTKQNVCSCYGTTKIGKWRKHASNHIFWPQQMKPKYNFWGSTNCQLFCSLTYPAKIAEKQEGSVFELDICELRLYSILDNVWVVFELLILIPNVFQYK